MVFFDKHKNFDLADKAWEDKATQLKNSHPLKVLKTLPKMPGVTPKTRRFLKLKSLKYLIFEDEHRLIPRFVMKKPLRYIFRLLKSYCKKKSYFRDKDLFFYRIKDRQEFEKGVKDKKSHLIVGFSYCQKPLECPSGRFTDKCIKDPQNPVCGQCFIGKCANTLSKKAAEFIFIPTVHYIGEKMFEAVEKHPDKQILFLITACELTLEMFSDWGNMLPIQGIGVRLDGRICNTMKAFELSEKGVKPGLTVLLDETQRQFLEFLRLRRDTFFS